MANEPAIYYQGVGASADFATVSGGKENTASGLYATVGGGYYNIADYELSTVSGGRINEATNYAATTGGGDNNKSSGYGSTVAGGISNNAMGNYSIVTGGASNSALGHESCTIGGRSNTALGVGSIVCGAPHLVYENENDVSTVLGVNNDGNLNNTFVWGDSFGINLNTFEPKTQADVNGDQTILNKNGNSVWFACGGAPNTTGPVFTILTTNARDDTAIGVYLNRGGSSWEVLCDRNKKENIRLVEPAEVVTALEGLPIYEYNYIGNPSDMRCRGPMAQDWYRQFPSATGPKLTLCSGDLDAAALAGVKGVAQLVRALEARASALEARADAAEAAFAALAARVAALEAP